MYRKTLLGAIFFLSLLTFAACQEKPAPASKTSDGSLTISQTSDMPTSSSVSESISALEASSTPSENSSSSEFSSNSSTPSSSALETQRNESSTPASESEQEKPSISDSASKTDIQPAMDDDLLMHHCMEYNYELQRFVSRDNFNGCDIRTDPVTLILYAKDPEEIQKIIEQHPYSQGIPLNIEVEQVKYSHSEEEELDERIFDFSQLLDRDLHSASRIEIDRNQAHAIFWVIDIPEAEEILEQNPVPGISIEFRQGKYSLNQMWEIQEELENIPLIRDNSDIVYSVFVNFSEKRGTYALITLEEDFPELEEWAKSAAEEYGLDNILLTDNTKKNPGIK